MVVKPFKTIDEQVELLAARGLVLEKDEAARWLRNVGYYRLSGYWYPYRLPAGVPGQVRRSEIEPGTTLNAVVRLYEFDRKLRTLIHDGTERIEVALRSHTSYRVGRPGPLAYCNPDIFRPEFNHRDWLTIAGKRVGRARRHSEPIKHHEARYGGEVPIWVLMEVLDFADVSKMFSGLRVADQFAIAEALNIGIDLSHLGGNQRAKAKKKHPIARWFEQLTVLRNICAHHARVWNRSFVPVGTAGLRTIDDLDSLPAGQSEQLYGAMTLMAFLLQEVSPGSSWPAKVRSLIEESFLAIPGRSPREMGFPDDWREAKPWSAGT